MLNTFHFSIFNFQFSIFNFPSLYVEYFGIGTGLDDVGQVLPVRIRNKDLPEVFTLNHFHDPFNPLAIKTIKNIIQ